MTNPTLGTESAQHMEPTFTDRISIDIMESSSQYKETGAAPNRRWAWTGDQQVLRAMLVSTGKDESEAATLADESAAYGRINYLMRSRHGSPFEHGSLTFRVAAPIFVWREHHRHRIGFSYNEESGRYKQLAPVFYIPGRSRNLTQTGKPGEYVFRPGSDDQYARMVERHKWVATVAYQNYEANLEDGIAKEVARLTLPVNIFSVCYVTMNPRSLMSFLSLRTTGQHPDMGWDTVPMWPSTPMREIEMVAQAYEEAFAKMWPLTYKSFCKNGRVAP